MAKFKNLKTGRIWSIPDIYYKDFKKNSGFEEIKEDATVKSKRGRKKTSSTITDGEEIKTEVKEEVIVDDVNS